MQYIITLLSILLPSVAFAHVGHEQAVMSVGLTQGFLHPLLGLDHLLVLIAVGVLSTRIEGKQAFMVPLAFMGLMLAGFFAAHAGMHLVSVGTIEMLISLSLVAAAGFVVLGQWLLKSGVFHAIAAWTVTVFAVAHGMAHGLEIPAGADAQGFAVGFAVACVSIMCATHIIARSLKRRTLKQAV